jgi:hypothetical protein
VEFWQRPLTNPDMERTEVKMRLSYVFKAAPV